MKLHRWIIGVFVLVFGIGIISRNTQAITALYNETVRIVDSAGTVLDGGVASATSASYNKTVRVVNSSGLVLDSFGAPGLSTMKTAPLNIRFTGDGSDGPGPASGAIAGVKNYTTWDCTGAITIATSAYVMVQGAATFAAGCSVTIATTSSSTVGMLGGTGGGSGGGTGAGAAGSNDNMFGSASIVSPGMVAGGVAGLAAGNGGDGNTPTLPVLQALVSQALGNIASAAVGLSCGGSQGAQGANSGGAKGSPPGCLLVFADTITRASGSQFIADGAGGVSTSGNNTGGGSGAGGGAFHFGARTITDNGAIFSVAGGPGGDCTIVQTRLTNAAGDNTGKDAYVHVASLGGGNPASITVDAGGTGYTSAPTCAFVGGAGAGATCTCTLSGTAVNACTPSGGNGAYTLATATGCGRGGYGAPGTVKDWLFQ